MELKTAEVLDKIQLSFQELNWPFIGNFGKRESWRQKKKKRLKYTIVKCLQYRRWE